MNITRNETYQRVEALPFRVLGAETVVLNIRCREVHVLNGTGAHIWTLLGLSRSMAQLMEALEVEFALDPASAQDEVTSFVADLVDKGLVVVSREERPLTASARCADDEIGAQADRAGVVTAIQEWAHSHCSPLNATIEVTQRCNIRCRHCYNFDRDEPRQACGDQRPELSTAEIKGAITALHQAGCLFLSLTGGEALLHPDLFAFIEHAASLNMAVQLLTNGLLLRPGMASELASHKNLLGVSVSLYGATAAVHDDITQVRGSFARTWAGAQLMRDKGVAVRVKFVLMRSNAHEAGQMMADAEARGFPFSIDLTVTARHDGSRNSLETRVDQGQLEQLYRGPLRPLIRLGPRAPVTSESFACNCARGNCAITAQGDVLPCISVPLVAGNIREQPFAEIWASSPVLQRIRGLRLADYPECSPCPHKAHCTHERGAAVTYSGSYTGTDPLVCARATLVHRLSDDSAASKEVRGTPDVVPEAP